MIPQEALLLEYAFNKRNVFDYLAYEFQLLRNIDQISLEKSPSIKLGILTIGILTRSFPFSVRIFSLNTLHEFSLNF